MSAIVTITVNPSIDLNCSVGHVVAEDKLRCHDIHYDAGGGGINVARMIQLLGGESKALWACGGTTGELLCEILDEKGLIHQPVRIAERTRQNMMVYSESTAEQYRFNMPGAALSAEEITNFIETVAKVRPTPEYFVLSGSLTPGAPKDFYHRMVQDIPSSSRVILDTSGEALRQALKEGVYLVKMNLRELRQITDHPVEHDDDIQRAACSLIDAQKAQVVVVSLGAGGAVYVTADTMEHLRSPTVPIRSKVGAGDSMVGGMTYKLSEGAPLAEAVRFGVACGAATVMTMGTTMGRREDVERLYRQMK